jgi:hypothetical protein
MLALWLFCGAVVHSWNSVVSVQKGNKALGLSQTRVTGHYNTARCRLFAVGFDETVGMCEETAPDRSNNNNKVQTKPPPRSTTPEQVIESYGMPWKTSIDPSYDRDFLFYMPFWELLL